MKCIIRDLTKYKSHIQEKREDSTSIREGPKVEVRKHTRDTAYMGKECNIADGWKEGFTNVRILHCSCTFLQSV